MFKRLRIALARRIAPELTLLPEVPADVRLNGFQRANKQRAVVAREMIAAFELKHGITITHEHASAVQKQDDCSGWTYGTFMLVTRLKRQPGIGCREQSLDELRWFLDRVAALPRPPRNKKEAA